VYNTTTFSYLKLNTSQNDYTAGACGGVVVRFVAGGTLLAGDVVFVSATGATVNKSTTANDYRLLAGIVVGNDDGVMLNADASGNAVGLQVATTGQGVLVQIDGVCNGIVGTSITAPVRVIPSAATAGRLIPYASGTQQLVGHALVTQATAGAPVRILLRNFVIAA